MLNCPINCQSTTLLAPFKRKFRARTYVVLLQKPSAHGLSDNPTLDTLFAPESVSPLDDYQPLRLLCQSESTSMLGLARSQRSISKGHKID
jgi:hypothetical protein